jgi:hypothetical protein
MRVRFAFGIVLVLVVLGFVVQLREVKAGEFALDQCCSEFGSVCNIQPIEDFWPNLTRPMYGFKHRFPADYSCSFLGFDDDAPLDAAESADAVVSAVPEFPPDLVLPIFLILTLIGMVACKKSASLSMRRS